MESKESPYYMGNEDCLPTELIIKTTDCVIKQELPWDANMEYMCQAFYSACIAATFDPNTVLEGMKEFLINKGVIVE